MAQLSDDCFAFGDALLPLADAVRMIGERVSTVAGVENASLFAAEGRILAADVIAPVDLPPFNNSAVDGYAVCADELRPDGDTILPVAGRYAAGRAAGSGVPGTAARVFTGAPMPAGFDTVFMQEDVRLEAGRAVLPPGLKPGANRRLAGEDLRRGAIALSAGRRLTPADLALLGALGVGEVPVRRRLRVALFSTGAELVAAGCALGAAAIHDANRPMLSALLARLGADVADGGILPDARPAIEAALAEAAGANDLVLTSGGVSTGEEDHVRAAVERIGGLAFWRLGIKPGRPVAMGVVGGTPFVGLPGNPVAAFVTFAFVARHLLARLGGESYAPPRAIPVRSGFGYRKKAGRREYVRVRLEEGEDGQPVVRKHPRDGAGVITSLTETDGLVELSEERLTVQEGEAVGFIPYASLL